MNNLSRFNSILSLTNPTILDKDFIRFTLYIPRNNNYGRKNKNEGDYANQNSNTTQFHKICLLNIIKNYSEILSPSLAIAS